ncbi:MAG: HAD hydrolase-like protein [Candidatus Pacebacteria bacterium]|nr:HAD hydrolase-like protein [Candidatus Paceibacterota bacterium]
MKKPKVILFDIDGVLIRFPNYFSEELEKQGYRNARESLDSFYKGSDNWECLEGKANLTEKIMPYLEKFGWKETAENYFKKQFQFEKQYLDQNLILQIEQFRSQGIKCYLCTDNTKIRVEFLLNEMNFRDIFDDYFVSCYIGFRKRHDDFWIYLINKLKKEIEGVNPGEVVFFDDIQNNVDVALKFGINAILFENVIQFEKNLISLKLSE